MYLLGIFVFIVADLIVVFLVNLLSVIKFEGRVIVILFLVVLFIRFLMIFDFFSLYREFLIFKSKKYKKNDGI